MLKVIIPAFPRSGTSFLAGLIVRMGFNPGPQAWLKKSNENNPFGYYECMPLLHISRKILQKFGGDFVKNIPDLPDGWMNELETERQQIADIVHSGKVKIFKDGPMLIIADLYHELFPGAKWIVIHRDIHETFRSRFGQELSFAEWKEITNKRWSKWRQSRPYSKALNINYADFARDFQGTIEKISTFLEVELTEPMRKECREFFKPGERKKMIDKGAI